MTTDIEVTRRKRLLFQSWHRGMKEMDLVLGQFADRHLADFSPAQLDVWENLLVEEDADIWEWLTGRSDVPPEYEGEIFARLRDFRFTV